jgi:hypothetical protein
MRAMDSGRARLSIRSAIEIVADRDDSRLKKIVRLQ